MPSNPTEQIDVVKEARELTRTEQIELAIQVMSQQTAKDLEVGRKWIESQRRIVIIERDKDHHA